MSTFTLCISITLALFACVTALWTGMHKSYADCLMSIYAFSKFKKESTYDLMVKFERRDFAPHAPEECWQDIPIVLNYSTTMPAPSYFGITIDAIYKFLKPGAKCLDIGSGTGYLSACMAEMVGPTGKVYAIEHIPYILERSIEAISLNHANLLDNGIIEFLCQDGRGGLHEKGPFDIIHLGGSVVKNPYHLMSQVKINGCLIAPIGLNYEQQSLRRFIKYNETTFKIDDITGTMQEPLLPRYEQERQWNHSLSEFNRTWTKFLESLKYEKFKEEKERKKAEEKLRAKMKTPLSVLDRAPEGIDMEKYERYVNDLSNMIFSNETLPSTQRLWNPANYAQKQDTIVLQDETMPPPEGIDMERYERYVNDLSNMMLSNDTLPFTQRLWNPANYTQKQNTVVLQDETMPPPEGVNIERYERYVNDLSNMMLSNETLPLTQRLWNPANYAQKQDTVVLQDETMPLPEGIDMEKYKRYVNDLRNMMFSNETLPSTQRLWNPANYAQKQDTLVLQDETIRAH